MAGVPFQRGANNAAPMPASGSCRHEIVEATFFARGIKYLQLPALFGPLNSQALLRQSWQPRFLHAYK
jgi:hypothetical protein